MSDEAILFRSRPPHRDWNEFRTENSAIISGASNGNRFVYAPNITEQTNDAHKRERALKKIGWLLLGFVSLGLLVLPARTIISRTGLRDRLMNATIGDSVARFKLDDGIFIELSNPRHRPAYVRTWQLVV